MKQWNRHFSTVVDGKVGPILFFLKEMLSWTQRFRSRLWGLIGAYSASITEIVGHLVNVSHGTSIDIGEKNLWTVGNLVVRFWYPSLVLVEFMSLPEIIAHRDACKRSEIIVVIAIVFTFFSISHHHHQNHHFFLKFIPPHGTTTAQMSWSCQYLSSQVWRIFSRPDCFENAKSRLSIGVTTFTPLPGCLVAEAYLQPAVVFRRALLSFCFTFFARRFQEKFGSADELVTALFASQMGMAWWQRPGAKNGALCER